ncbi:Alpha-ketoglutarate-dependent dioxygenase abh1 [Linum grandiflorum]
MIRLSRPISAAIRTLETSPSIRLDALPLFFSTGLMNCSTVNTAVQGFIASYSSSIHSETNCKQAVADIEKQSSFSKQETLVNYSKLKSRKVRMPRSNCKRRRIRIVRGSEEISSSMEVFASGSEDCESSLPTQFGKKRIGRAKKSDSSERASKSVHTNESSLVSETFDICQRGSNDLQCLQNVDRHVVTKQEILRPGMVLLKHYIPHDSQDRDESRESLERGLPVVSLSIGDSAEFLYGEDRDKEMAERVTLESGDVVIFGGKSRHIFHGVASIIPHSAPKSLVEETRLCKGRLNLTFRQY